MMNRHRSIAGVGLMVLALSACDSTDQITAPEGRFAAVDGQRLLAAAREPGQWMTTGGDYEEQHFSRLTGITPGNIAGLRLAWFDDLETNVMQESTPLVIDGVMYVSEAWSKVSAYDAATGERLWKYDPKVPGERGAMACCGVANRGVAAWKGKIYVGTFDGRLVALNAETGQEVWSVVTVDQSQPYSITGAPRVVKGLVIIGNGGAELGVRGYVTAYDVETGEMVWRFYTVPGDPAAGPDGASSDDVLATLAARTWDGEFWKQGGGGTVWDAIVYDPVNDLLYLGVGNGSPWNATWRSPGTGDNLFLSSIVAVRPETGEYVWHFQETPRESWDYTATMPIMVADIEIDGRPRRVVMQAPKNGFFYVLDAATGQFISADNYVPQNWALGIDPVTGRADVDPRAHYDTTGEAVIITPGPGGGHSWHPWAFNPDTGLVYLPAHYTSGAFTAAPGTRIGIYNVGVDWLRGAYLYDLPENAHFPKPAGPTSQLIAWDPVARKAVWKAEMKKDGGAGVLATATGLVFQGTSATEELVAYRASDGERLWSQPIGAGVGAAPVSYEVNGEQFIALVVGAGARGGYYAPNHSRVLAFKLGGTAELPPAQPFDIPVLDPPPATAPAELVARGQDIYTLNCAICHGDGAVARAGGRGTLFPDLRYSPALYAAEDFNAIVLMGERQQNGMRSFASVLDPQDTDAIRAYVIAQANRAK